MIFNNKKYIPVGKTLVREVWLDQFRADFNKKTQIISEQEQLIHSFQKELVPKLKKQIEELKADNFLLKKEIEIKESLSEEIQVNSAHLNENQEEEPSFEEPISNTEIISELENKSKIANNFQTKTIFGKRPLTEMELEIIALLRRNPYSYMDLKGKIGNTNERALAVHISNLRKYFGIEVQKLRKHKINFYYINTNQLISYIKEIENFEKLNQEKYYELN